MALPDKQDLSKSDRWKILIIVIISISIVGLSLGLTSPLISLVLEARGVSSSLIGLVASMTAFGIIVISPIIPRIITFAGSTSTLYSAIFTGGTSILLLPFMESIYAWLFLRLVLGCANGILFATSETLINHIAFEKNRGKLISLYSVVLSLCFAGGPVLIYFLGTKGPLPFVVAALILYAGAIPLFFTRVRIPRLEGKSGFNVFLFLKMAPLLCYAVMIHAFMDISSISLLPIFGVRHGYTDSTAAMMVTVLVAGGTVLQIPLGWLADNMKRYTLLLICGIAFFVCAASLSFVISIPILLWPVLVLLGGAVGGIYIVTITLIGQKFKGAELITANATLGFVWGIGSLLGPLATGFSMQLLNPDGFTVTLTLASMLFLALFTIKNKEF
ncbi:MAG: MFS transporter [Desulfobacterales bacterium]|nr:MFS transporter [Desulfobacterales bacterium]